MSKIIQSAVQAACNANERSESLNIMDIYNSKAFYAVTIKCIKKDYYATDTELIKVLTELERAHKGEIHDFTIERDSLDRLHLHATMIARKGLRYTLFRKKYWHLDITRLMSHQDLVQWTKYIHKDDCQNLIDYYENGENHFIDGPSGLED